MLDWRREWGQSAIGICAFLYMSNLFGLVVFQGSIFELEEGVGSVCHGYMCILQCVKLISCSGFPEIYADLEEKVGSFCHGNMSILLYVKLISCSQFSKYLSSIGGGGVVSLSVGMCAFISISNLFGVVILQRSIFGLEKGSGVKSALGICASLYM